MMMNQIFTLIILVLVLSFSFSAAIPALVFAQQANTTNTTATWTRGEMRVGTMVVHKFIANSNSSINMLPSIDVITERGIEGVSLEQFKAFKDQGISKIENLSIIANQTTTLAKNTAFERVMTGDYLGVPYGATQIFTVAGDRGITVTYVAEAHEFDTYLPYYDYIVNFGGKNFFSDDAHSHLSNIFDRDLDSIDND